MKAKTVYENIEFKRGISPETSLEIGRYRKIMNPDISDIKKLPDGKYIIVKKPMAGDNLLYLVFDKKSSHFFFGTFWEISEKNALERFSNNKFQSISAEELWDNIGLRFQKPEFIKPLSETIEENINFKRGLEPKESLDLGRKKLENNLYDNMAKQIEDWKMEQIKPGEIRIWAKMRAKNLPNSFKKIDFESVSTFELGVLWSNFFLWYDEKQFQLKVMRRKMQENLDFKRGIEPTESLRIGKYAEKQPPENIEDLEPGIYMAYTAENTYFQFMREEEHRGGVMKGKNKDSEDEARRISWYSCHSEWDWTLNSHKPEVALGSRQEPRVIWIRRMRDDEILLWKQPDLDESMGFKRGLTPKDSLKVGRKYTGVKNPTVADLKDLGPGDYIVSSWSVDGMMFYTKIRMNPAYVQYPENLWADNFNFFIDNDIELSSEGNLINAEYEDFLEEWNIKFIISADKNQIVKENLDFKRGIDPKESLKIGYNQKLLDAIDKELKWNSRHYDVQIYSSALEDIKALLDWDRAYEIIPGTTTKVRWIDQYDKAIEILEKKYGIEPDDNPVLR